MELRGVASYDASSILIDTLAFSLVLFELSSVKAHVNFYHVIVFLFLFFQSNQFFPLSQDLLICCNLCPVSVSETTLSFCSFFFFFWVIKVNHRPSLIFD